MCTVRSPISPQEAADRSMHVFHRRQNMVDRLTSSPELTDAERQLLLQTADAWCHPQLEFLDDNVCQWPLRCRRMLKASLFPTAAVGCARCRDLWC